MAFSFMALESVRIAGAALHEKATTAYYQSEGAADVPSDPFTLSDDGYFAFGMLPEGNYNVLALDSDGASVRIAPLRVLGLVPKPVRDLTERLRLIEARLANPGSFATSVSTAAGESVSTIPFKELALERDRVEAQLTNLRRELSGCAPGRFV